MLKLIVMSIVLLSSCAHHHVASTSPTQAPDPRACNEPAYSVPFLTQDDMGPSAAVVAVAGLAVVAVADPGAFRCKPGNGVSQKIVIKRPEDSKVTEYKVERP